MSELPGAGTLICLGVERASILQAACRSRIAAERTLIKLAARDTHAGVIRDIISAVGGGLT